MLVMSEKWDTYFMAMCDFVAQLSKDPSTKLGCIIVGPKKEVRSSGYNGMPRGVDDGVLARMGRPDKYLYFEHAERNALYNALLCGTSVEGCTLFCQWLPCADCARAIIQAGIAEVVVADMTVPHRWGHSVNAGIEMMREAGVSVRLANTITTNTSTEGQQNEG